MRRFILITGPTGSGKSNLSVQLAKIMNTEIISADSVQVYKGFNIGSGKVTEEEKEGIAHHLIDIKKGDEPYSAADFYEEAVPRIDRLNGEGKIPIICGGTALYIHGLIYDIQFGNKPSMEYRNELNTLYEEEGLDPLVEMLEKKNPELAAKTDLLNPRRVMRALEKIETGNYEPENLRKKREDVEWDYFILNWDRETLYDRINRRVLQMVEDGLFQEVEELYKHYGDVKPLQAIGYKEVVSYLRGEWDREVAIEKIQQHSRNFAKRQLTWFRKEEDGIFLDMETMSVEEAIKTVLERVNYNDK